MGTWITTTGVGKVWLSSACHRWWTPHVPPMIRSLIPSQLARSGETMFCTKMVSVSIQDRIHSVCQGLEAVTWGNDDSQIIGRNVWEKVRKLPPAISEWHARVWLTNTSQDATIIPRMSGKVPTLSTKAMEQLDHESFLRISHLLTALSQLPPETQSCTSDRQSLT
jgi:hypothetical protein